MQPALHGAGGGIGGDGSGDSPGGKTAKENPDSDQALTGNSQSMFAWSAEFVG
jgi:hypothetical protein